MILHQIKVKVSNLKIPVHPVLDPLTFLSKLLSAELILLGTKQKIAGKSRADLWELAALVALDLTVERANRACDLDFHARHQVFLSLFLSSLTYYSFYSACITITGDFVGKQREMRNQADKATEVPDRCFNY